MIVNTVPLAKEPATIDIECGNAAPTGAKSIGSYLLLSGETANENCTAKSSLTVGYSDGSLVGTNCNGTITRT